MNPRYRGPEVLPPAAQVRKRVEEHLETLPDWQREPRGAAEPPGAGVPGTGAPDEEPRGGAARPSGAPGWPAA